MQYVVKQGDCLSPTLFDLYCNDMVDDIKKTCDGIQIEHFKVHCGYMLMILLLFHDLRKIYNVC